jgi:peptidoglycan/LPS O-acetylase OafA/YrhL
MPVLVAAFACAISLVIVTLFSDGNPFIYLAYLCTPFVPIGGLALARATDIKGRTNTKFDIAKSAKVVKICGVISIIGFLIAIAVMYEIAMRLSQI